MDLFRRALRLSPGHTGTLVATSVVSGLLPAVQVLTMGRLVDALNSDSAELHVQALAGLLAVLAGLAAASQVLGAVRGMSFQAVTTLVSTELSTSVMEHAIELPPAQTEQPEILDSMQRAMRESQFRPTQAIQQTLDVLGQLTTVASVGAVLGSMNPWVALLALAAPCPVVYAQWKAGRRGFALEQSRAEQRRRLVYWPSLLADPASAREVHAFGIGGFIVARFRTAAEAIVRQDMALFRRVTGLTMSMALVSVALNLTAQIVALWVALSHGTLGVLIAVIQGIVAIQSAGSGLFGGAISLSNTAMYLANIERFLSLKPHARSRGTSQAPHRLHTGIEFCAVSFTYPGQTQPALDGVSFVLRPGMTTAVMGRNGAGKSTVVKLLCGIYTPSSGQILIDGVPLDEISEASLLDAMTFVFQDYAQYNVSAAENIGLGSLEHLDDEARVRAAGARASIAQHLDALPAGWQTPLGRTFDAGLDLSGGQWQKVAIARSLMRDVPVRLLDEPTSSLDPISEKAIFDQFDSREPGVTTLLVAHRFSTVRFADHVIVMESGRVAAQGPHHTLMTTSPLYRELYDAQEF
ncbi:multidrug ABC transporter permease [Cellulomonas soli]|uniref:Multidrug ABC transporter permease n=2 Tax=Cellulomonas soli TaxID=931535 RepID=A0A512PCY8_9CELL|nr:multidrug ABC transporter permease [Cellulomonas soli]